MSNQAPKRKLRAFCNSDECEGDSTIHLLSKNRKWVCQDCGHSYPPLKKNPRLSRIAKLILKGTTDD